MGTGRLVTDVMIDDCHLWSQKKLFTQPGFQASPEYWDTLQFLAWLYSESPVKETVVTNDR